jgi:histidine triad (HIT) family protein
VLESERTIAFRDINPQAPIHVLVIPKAHYADLAGLASTDDGLLSEVAAQGQTVAHAHAHVLGGRPMTWPPG